MELFRGFTHHNNQPQHSQRQTPVLGGRLPDPPSLSQTPLTPDEQQQQQLNNCLSGMNADLEICVDQIICQNMDTPTGPKYNDWEPSRSPLKRLIAPCWNFWENVAKI